MREKAREMLRELYDFTIKGNKNSAQINQENAEQWKQVLDTVDYLVTKRLIEKVYQSIGYVGIKLTQVGIEFVEDELL